MNQRKKTGDQEIADVLRRISVEQYGLRPYDASIHTPRDVGYGGPSTEYLATEYDPYGAAMNYPTIWWDMYGNPVVLDQGAAFNQALAYEDATGKSFPRYMTTGQAETAAQHRSANGGGDASPLATLLGLVNW